MSIGTLPVGTADATLEKLYPTSSTYVTRPVQWVEEVLGGYLWSKQRHVASSVVKHRYTAVHSAHSTGKSYLASRLAAWWIDTHKEGEAFVVTTAPTAAQVEAILWREISRAHKAGDLSGRITGGPIPMWKLGGEIVAYGRKPADYDQAAFQGIHAMYVLVIMDEACGIPRSLYDAVDTLATNENCRVLAIGNPDDPASHFATVCQPGSGWNVIGISAFDTPAFTAEQYNEDFPKNLLDLLVSPTWVTERKHRWGDESPLFISKVLGVFPEVSDDTLITPAMVRRACENILPGVQSGHFGADIARMGHDETAIYLNRGGQIRLVAHWGKTNTMRSAGKIKQILEKNPGIEMHIDVIGLGAGVYDRLREQDCPVYPFDASNRPIRTHGQPKFQNRRAETWWAFRELFEEGLVDLDPLDLDLAAELQEVKYFIGSNGKVQIEEKIETKKRLGRSPDRGDGAMMSTITDGQWGEADLRDEMDSITTETGDLLERAL